MDSVDGIGKTVCGLQYAIGGCYGRDRDPMMLIVECVCDAFTPHIIYDDTNAMVVGGDMGEVSCFGRMITPRFALDGFLMNEDLCAERCHWHGVKQEGPFQRFVRRQERVKATWAHHVKRGVALHCELAPMG